jgi:putative ABC transport system substrate-binding protein
LLSSLQETRRRRAAHWGCKSIIFNASTKDQIDAAFASFTRVRPDALLIGGDAFFLSRRVQLVTLTTRHGLPTIYNARELPAAWRPGILKGAKPAELPVMQPAKFDLVINLTTAKALGLTVPDKLLALADEVIE